MNRLLIRLWGLLEGEDAESVNYQIAQKLVKNISSIQHTSTSALAKFCHVSKPSISRFCKELGYDDFYEFRAELNQYLPDRGMKYLIAESEGETDWFTGYLNGVEKNLLKMRSWQLQKQIERLAQDIHDFSKVYLVGNMQSGKTAANLHYNLHVVKKNISAVTSLRGQRDIFASGSGQTLFVVFSVSGEYFRAIYPGGQMPLQTKDSKVWLVTTNPAADCIEGFDEILNLATGSDLSGSNICMEMVANMIAFYYWRYCR